MKISVITAVYNNERYIQDAIESVLAQDYHDIEFIVIDGKSNDSTLNIINQFSNDISVLISEPDSGIYDALNKGISAATGDVVGFMHSDDLFNDNRVLSDIAEKFTTENADGVYGDLVYIDKDEPGKIIRHWKSGSFERKKLYRGWMPPHPTLYLRKSQYEQIGNFDTRFRIAADYDFLLRLLHRDDISIAYVPKVLVKMRVGGESNRSIRNIIRKSREDYQALRNNKAGGAFTLAMKNLSKIPQFLFPEKNT